MASVRPRRGREAGGKGTGRQTRGKAPPARAAGRALGQDAAFREKKPHGAQRKD